MLSIAQLHCYLPDEDAEPFRWRAARAGMSVSRYLAELARKDLMSERPEEHFVQLFGHDGIAPIERGTQGDLENRPPPAHAEVKRARDPPGMRLARVGT